MINCNIERILNTCKSAARQDRDSKIKSGQLNLTDPEGKQYVKNELVRARWIIIELYKHMNNLYECKRICDNDYKYFESINDPVRRAEAYLKISEINSLIENSSKYISNLGELFIEVLNWNILSEHDVCQLFNINWKTFQSRKQRYKNNFKEKDNLIFKTISIAGAEYRDRKGRAKGIYDCDEYEMPVYWAIGDRIMQEIDINKDVKEKVRKGIKEFFPSIKTYRTIEDLEGNIIRIVADK